MWNVTVKVGVLVGRTGPVLRRGPVARRDDFADQIPSTAAATASCSSAWTSTFAARSVVTLVTVGPGTSRRAVSVVGRGDVRRIEVVGPRQGDEVRPVRRPEQLLEPIVLQDLGLRQEREDPAAVVVDDHDPQIDAALGERRQGAAVVQQRQVTDQRHRRRAADRYAQGRGHHAVDAVGPAVGVGACPRSAVPLEVAHRHGRCGDQLGVGWQPPSDGARRPRLGQAWLTGEHGIDRRLGGTVGGGPPVAPHVVPIAAPPGRIELVGARS